MDELRASLKALAWRRPGPSTDAAISRALEGYERAVHAVNALPNGPVRDGALQAALEASASFKASRCLLGWLKQAHTPPARSWMFAKTSGSMQPM